MDDLFKNIKDNLGNRPEPTFDKKAWQDMEKRLDKKPWHGGGQFAWALPVALAVLFMSNLFFFKKLNDANEKISKIELRADTIFQTKYIYQYDTLYRERVETQYVTLAPEVRHFYVSSNNFIASESKPNSNYAPATFSEMKYLFDDSSNENSTSLAQNNSQSNSLKEVSFLTSDMSPLTYESSEMRLSLLDIPTEQKRKKRPFQKLASELQPIGFQLGMIAGLAYPQHANVAETNGLAFGIHGAVVFSKNIRLWGEASRYNVEFKSEEMGNSLGIPEVETPDDFEFVEASVNQPFYQYVLGLQYLFNTKKKWNPYFGIGYTFASMQSYEVSYDFEHLVDDVEMSIEEMNERNDMIWNMFLLNGGFEGKLSKHIGLQFEGYYRWNGNKTGLLVTDILGLRGKLLYHF